MADNRWNGLDEAMAKMRGLAPNLRRNGFRQAGTAAMRPVRDQARAGAAKLDDPATKANISKKVVTRSGSRKDERRYGPDTVVTKVGVQGGSRAYKDNRQNRRAGRAGKSYAIDDPETYHWRFLELGTSKMAARPFMVPALEANADKVIGLYAASLGPAIDKAVANAAKRATRGK